MRTKVSIFFGFFLLVGCGGDDDDGDDDVVDSAGGGDGASADAVSSDGGGSAGDASSGPTDAAPLCVSSAELQAELDEYQSSRGVPAAALGVLLLGNCAFHGTAGDPVPNDRFRIASLTKSFTAAVVLQLVDEGVLSLDDPLSGFVPDFPDGDEILVRHLLSHTSGVYNYTSSSSFWPYMDQPWTPAEMVAIAAEHGPDFAPGASFNYSNTNYVLLGMVIEAATGDSYAHQLRSRLFDPLGLADTFLEGDEAIPGGFVHGYSGGVDITDSIHPSAAWAAGAIVSNTRDLTRWAEALMTGEVLSAGLLSEMTSPQSSSGYGFGLARDDTSDGPYIGHTGSINGFTSSFGWFPDHDAIFAALVDEDGSDAWNLEASAWPLAL